MADNVTTNAGSGGDTIAADDIAGVKFQRVKLVQGADGSNDGDVSSAAPLQVTLANTGANTNKILVTPDLPSGASTSAKQDTGNTSLASIDGKITAVNTGNVTVSSSALPSGAATSANQTTANSSLATLAGAVYAEDLASQNADPGIQALTVRKNTAAATSGTDGDYQPLITDGNGKLWTNTGLTQPTTPSDTQPVSAASLPLPSGAATSAKQPALGTAGTASSDVITVQGITSMTPLKVDNSANTQPVSYATTGHGTATGALRVELPTDGTGVVNAAQSGTWTNTVTQGTATNLKTQAENYQGGSAVGSGNPLQVTLANTGSNSTAVKVDNSAVTQPVSGSINIAPATSGGLSVFNATSGDGSTALTNTAQEIKASAGQLFGWAIYNPNSVAAYVPIYNTASGSVTVGTTNPLFLLTIPPQAASNFIGETGIAFGTAISASAVSTAGGNGALSTALDANFFYK